MSTSFGQTWMEYSKEHKKRFKIESQQRLSQEESIGLDPPFIVVNSGLNHGWKVSVLVTLKRGKLERLDQSTFEKRE